MSNIPLPVAPENSVTNHSYAYDDLLDLFLPTEENAGLVNEIPTFLPEKNHLLNDIGINIDQSPYNSSEKIDIDRFTKKEANAKESDSTQNLTYSSYLLELFDSKSKSSSTKSSISDIENDSNLVSFGHHHIYDSLIGRGTNLLCDFTTETSTSEMDIKKTGEISGVKNFIQEDESTFSEKDNINFYVQHGKSTSSISGTDFVDLTQPKAVITDQADINTTSSIIKTVDVSPQGNFHQLSFSQVNKSPQFLSTNVEKDSTVVSEIVNKYNDDLSDIKQDVVAVLDKCLLDIENGEKNSLPYDICGTFHFTAMQFKQNTENSFSNLKNLPTVKSSDQENLAPNEHFVNTYHACDNGFIFGHFNCDKEFVTDLQSESFVLPSNFNYESSQASVSLKHLSIENNQNQLQNNVIQCFDGKIENKPVVMESKADSNLNFTKELLKSGSLMSFSESNTSVLAAVRNAAFVPNQNYSIFESNLIDTNIERYSANGKEDSLMPNNASLTLKKQIEAFPSKTNEFQYNHLPQAISLCNGADSYENKNITESNKFLAKICSNNSDVTKKVSNNSAVENGSLFEDTVISDLSASDINDRITPQFSHSNNTLLVNTVSDTSFSDTSFQSEKKLTEANLQLVKDEKSQNLTNNVENFVFPIQLNTLEKNNCVDKCSKCDQSNDQDPKNLMKMITSSTCDKDGGCNVDINSVSACSIPNSFKSVFEANTNFIKINTKPTIDTTNLPKNEVYDNDLNNFSVNEYETKNVPDKTLFDFAHSVVEEILLFVVDAVQQDQKSLSGVSCTPFPTGFIAENYSNVDVAKAKTPTISLMSDLVGITTNANSEDTYLSHGTSNQPPITSNETQEGANKLLSGNLQNKTESTSNKSTICNHVIEDNTVENNAAFLKCEFSAIKNPEELLLANTMHFSEETYTPSKFSTGIGSATDNYCSKIHFFPDQAPLVCDKMNSDEVLQRTSNNKDTSNSAIYSPNKAADYKDLPSNSENYAITKVVNLLPCELNQSARSFVGKDSEGSEQINSFCNITDEIQVYQEKCSESNRIDICSSKASSESDEGSMFDLDGINISDTSSEHSQVECKLCDVLSLDSLEFDDNPFTVEKILHEQKKPQIFSHSNNLIPSTVFVTDEWKDEGDHSDSTTGAFVYSSNSLYVKQPYFPLYISSQTPMVGNSESEVFTFDSSWEEIQHTKPKINVLSTIFEETESETDDTNSETSSDQTCHFSESEVFQDLSGEIIFEDPALENNDGMNGNISHGSINPSLSNLETNYVLNHVVKAVVNDLLAKVTSFTDNVKLVCPSDLYNCSVSFSTVIDQNPLNRKDSIVDFINPCVYNSSDNQDHTPLEIYNSIVPNSKQLLKPTLHAEQLIANDQNLNINDLQLSSFKKEFSVLKDSVQKNFVNLETTDVNQESNIILFSSEEGNLKLLTFASKKSSDLPEITRPRSSEYFEKSLCQIQKYLPKLHGAPSVSNDNVSENRFDKLAQTTSIKMTLPQHLKSEDSTYFTESLISYSAPYTSADKLSKNLMYVGTSDEDLILQDNCNSQMCDSLGLRNLSADDSNSLSCFSEIKENTFLCEKQKCNTSVSTKQYNESNVLPIQVPIFKTVFENSAVNQTLTCFPENCLTEKLSLKDETLQSDQYGQETQLHFCYSTSTADKLSNNALKQGPSTEFDESNAVEPSKSVVQTFDSFIESSNLLNQENDIDFSTNSGFYQSDLLNVENANESVFVEVPTLVKTSECEPVFLKTDNQLPDVFTSGIEEKFKADPYQIKFPQKSNAITINKFENFVQHETAEHAKESKINSLTEIEVSKHELIQDEQLNISVDTDIAERTSFNDTSTNEKKMFDSNYQEKNVLFETVKTISGASNDWDTVKLKTSPVLLEKDMLTQSGEIKMTESKPLSLYGKTGVALQLNSQVSFESTDCITEQDNVKENFSDSQSTSYSDHSGCKQHENDEVTQTDSLIQIEVSKRALENINDKKVTYSANELLKKTTFLEDVVVDQTAVSLSTENVEKEAMEIYAIEGSVYEKKEALPQPGSINGVSIENVKEITIQDQLAVFSISGDNIEPTALANITPSTIHVQSNKFCAKIGDVKCSTKSSHILQNLQMNDSTEYNSSNFSLETVATGVCTLQNDESASLQQNFTNGEDATKYLSNSHHLNSYQIHEDSEVLDSNCAQAMLTEMNFSKDSLGPKKKLILDASLSLETEKTMEQYSRKSHRNSYGTVGNIDSLFDSDEDLDNFTPTTTMQVTMPNIVSLEDPPVVSVTAQTNALQTKRRSIAPPSSLLLSVAVDELKIQTPTMTPLSDTSMDAEGDSQVQNLEVDSSVVLAVDALDGSFEAQEQTKPRIPQPVLPATMKKVITWEKIIINNIEYKIDEDSIQPYKRVISHGGFYKNKSTIVEIFGRYLPDSSIADYAWVVDNLFLYMLSTIELLVQDQEYVIVFFNNSVTKNQFPSTTWMKKNHLNIPKFLRKNLKGFYVVQSSFYMKTVINFSRMFINRKAFKKIKHVKNHIELKQFIPIDFLYVPEDIVRKCRQLQNNQNQQMKTKWTWW